MPKITLHNLARAMGRSDAELTLLLQSLYPSGFPRPSPKNGDFDSLRILAWVVAQQEFQVDLVSALNASEEEATNSDPNSTDSRN